MSGPAVRPGRAALLVLVGLGLLLAGCLDLPERTHNGPAPGAESLTIRTADDRPLDARLWTRDPSRLVIYLHAYHRTQRDWWQEAARGAPTDPSALTVDLRGHGDSGGEPNDFPLMVDDVQTVIAAARERGFVRIALVGASMGGTVAVLVAREEPAVTVIGLSVPADFAGLDALPAAREIAPRLSLVATREDLSARESLEQIAKAAGLDRSRAVLLPGRSHGMALLRGESEEPTRRLIQESLSRAWRLSA